MTPMKAPTSVLWISTNGIFERVPESVPHRAFELAGLGDGAAFDDHGGQLGDGEQADHHGHEADAIEQIDAAESVALDSQDRIDPDQADGDAERAHRQPLQGRAERRHRDDRQARAPRARNIPPGRRPAPPSPPARPRTSGPGRRKCPPPSRRRPTGPWRPWPCPAAPSGSRHRRWRPTTPRPEC